MPRKTKEELAAARQAARDEVERFLKMPEVNGEWYFEKRPHRMDQLSGYRLYDTHDYNKDLKEYFEFAKTNLNHMRECKDLKELGKTLKAIQDAEPEIFRNCIYMHNKIEKLLNLFEQYKNNQR